MEGTKNVAIGENSLKALVTGDANIGIGYNAGLNLDTTNVGDGHNTLIGDQVAQLVPDGNYNTLIGANACVASTSTLTSWTVCGSNVAEGLNITGSNVSIIGFQGQPSSASVSNEITLGNSSISALRCQVDITVLSDERDKTGIEDIPVGLDFVNALKPRFFTWDRREEEEGSPYIDKKDTGFIAQELDETQNEFGVEENLNLVYKSNPDKLEATYGRLVPVLVKAIQELSAKVEELEGRLNNE
jgi:hypothetical protein